MAVTAIVASLVTTTSAGAAAPTPHKGSSLAARPAAREGGGRPDPGFGPSQRRTELKRQQRLSDSTADRLGLGPARGARRQGRDARHRRHRARPLRPHLRRPAGHRRRHGRGARDLAARCRPHVPPTPASPSRRRRQRCLRPREGACHRCTGQRASARPPVKVVFAAHHRPCWRGRPPSGAPRRRHTVRDLVYTDASTGRQLDGCRRSWTPRARSLYSGTVRINTVRSGSTYRLIDNARGVSPHLQQGGTRAAPLAECSSRTATTTGATARPATRRAQPSTRRTARRRPGTSTATNFSRDGIAGDGAGRTPASTSRSTTTTRSGTTAASA